MTSSGSSRSSPCSAGPIAAPIRFVAALEAQLEVFDEFTIEPEGFHESAGRVAVPVRQRARGSASGVEVEIRIGHLWTVEDGEVVRLEVFAAPEDAQAALSRS